MILEHRGLCRPLDFWGFWWKTFGAMEGSFCFLTVVTVSSMPLTLVAMALMTSPLVSATV
jgi:hypothetical protein